MINSIQNFFIKPFPETTLLFYKHKSTVPFAIKRALVINRKKSCPVAYDISDRAIHLPCAFTLTEEQIQHYAGCIKKVLGA